MLLIIYMRNRRFQCIFLSNISSSAMTRIYIYRISDVGFVCIKFRITIRKQYILPAFEFRIDCKDAARFTQCLVILNINSVHNLGVK